MVHPFNGLFSDKIKWSIKSHKDMDKYQMPIMKWNKSFWKCFAVSNHIYSRERQNYVDSKWVSSFPLLTSYFDRIPMVQATKEKKLNWTSKLKTQFTKDTNKNYCSSTPKEKTDHGMEKMFSNYIFDWILVNRMYSKQNKMKSLTANW